MKKQGLLIVMLAGLMAIVGVSEKVEVKAAQGVRRLPDAIAVVEIGATRFGVSRTEGLLAEYDEAYG